MSDVEKIKTNIEKIVSTLKNAFVVKDFFARTWDLETFRLTIKDAKDLLQIFRYLSSQEIIELEKLYLAFTPQEYEELKLLKQCKKTLLEDFEKEFPKLKKDVQNADSVMSIITVIFHALKNDDYFKDAMVVMTLKPIISTLENILSQPSLSTALALKLVPAVNGILSIQEHMADVIKKSNIQAFIF